MKLSEIIIKKIKEEGPVSFRDFMEMALYYPGIGYYSSGTERTGSKGDFYTSPVLTSVFGEMIGKQLEEMWQVLGEQEFVIVEFGAGSGLLCHDILKYLKHNTGLFQKIRYCIIEKNPVMRSKFLPGDLGEKVSWHNSISGIGNFTGCILSNELPDNFPVHLVEMHEELMEVFVDHDNVFIELLKPASSGIKNYLAEQNIILPRGYRTEINLNAIEWLKEISSQLQKGFVITIDYGYTSDELFNSNRSSGTLVCYYRHSINYEPFHNIGEQDITSHVNFSALVHWGNKYGLALSGFTSQALFLQGLGLSEYLRKKEMNESVKPLQLYTLLMDMGKKFKVLIQQKGSNPVRLSGMMFGEFLI